MTVLGGLSISGVLRSSAEIRIGLLQKDMSLLVLTLARGSLYALIAVGFSLVFGTGRVLNLFHGGFFLLGAYAAFFLSRILPAGGALRQLSVTLLAALLV